jgi:hypothetical protein
LLSPESSISLFCTKQETGNAPFPPPLKYNCTVSPFLCESTAIQTYEDEVEKAKVLTGRQYQPESGQGCTVEGDLLSPESSISLFCTKQETGNGTVIFVLIAHRDNHSIP